ncbi:hypothetical protein [Acidovorax sp. ACV01]|nr:hypothetical protein [Acidovorax sp. ACV01]
MAFIARVILTLFGIYLIFLIFSSWEMVGLLALWMLVQIAGGKR